MEILTVNGKERTVLGKKGSKQVRKENRIPCVMYDLNQVVHFSVEFNEIKHLIYTPDFKLANINIDGKQYKCFLKAYQSHPVTDAITHIDFLHLIENQPIKIDVPVRFKGSSPGVKVGGKLQQTMRRVKLKTTLEHLIDHVTVDVSTLELGQSVRVRDIKDLDGIEVMTNGGTPVAIIEIPRSLRSATSGADEGGEEGATEEEVI